MHMIAGNEKNGTKNFLLEYGILLTLSTHAREDYSSRPVCLSRFDFGDY